MENSLEDTHVKPNTEPKFECPLTGAHFKFTEMCERLAKLKKEREFNPRPLLQKNKFNTEFTLVERIQHTTSIDVQTKFPMVKLASPMKQYESPLLATIQRQE